MKTGATRFKELCLDTSTGGTAAGEFWAAATGCEFVRTDHAEDPGDVVGAREGMGIAMCTVPEPKTAKNRVHLDVHTESIDALTALGATVLREPDEDIHWTVMADPEGNEFCAFLREPSRLPAYKAFELVVDAVDPVAIGAWWADVFGRALQHSDRKAWCWFEDVPGMEMESWVFNPVPEPKTVKNRLHWDVYGDVADLMARGATLLREMPRWTVLADPEGNEFCVFP